MAIRYNYNKNSLLNFYGSNKSINSYKELIENCLVQQDSLAICLLDISKFKLYNFMHGYEYGDKVLDIVFSKVQECVNNGRVYRFRGDVLLILLYKINNKEDAISIIEGIVEAFNSPVDIGEEKLNLLVNIGISLYPSDSIEVECAFKYAEIALVHSKNIYEDRYKFFELEMYESIIKKGKIESDILNAINNNEFILYYQPQIDTNSMKVYGVEALVRWNHPQYGVLPPSYFIEIVEQNGMIKEIGKFVFFEACSQIKIWNDLGYNNLSMSINISEKQFDDDSFLNFIDNMLKKTGVNPNCLIIEITERILIRPTERILNILAVLRNKGFKLFIDDFGTDYSALNYLYQFTIDGIKIDKSFIDRIQESEKELIITKSIIKLAREINIDVVAEGVEKEEQLECLKNTDCSKIQGFVFSKPVNAKECTDFLRMFNK